MQIESLKVFCDLVESESFTRAAQINKVTQSAVSQTITTMERQFKALLVERSKKHFRMTREGEVVYQQSKQILQNFEALHSKIQEIQNVVSGNIRVASVYSLGLHELPPYIRRFMQQYPEVNVQLEYKHPSEVYEDVLSNVVDIGMLTCPHPDRRLELVSLRKDRLVLICNPQHPFARLKSIGLKALKGQKFISFEKDMDTRQVVDKIFKDAGIMVEHVNEFNNIETVKRAVEIDAGVALVPEVTVKLETANRTLAAVTLEGNHSWPVGLVYKKGRVLSPALKKFVALLKEPL
jgi:DNA-binding transcriptional LysR family regulator